MGDNFEGRRKKLEGLSDEELYERFWYLADEIVKPLVDLAYKSTSPAIERSVLLRMGFSSLEAKAIVDGVEKKGLLSKGAGNVVYRFAKDKGLDIRSAGLMLIEENCFDEAANLFMEVE